jgi:hypothetical protein
MKPVKIILKGGKGMEKVYCGNTTMKLLDTTNTC